MMAPMAEFDLVVAGAGIVGLAHALAAVRRGLRVAVVERHASAGGASVQNFGFITIAGQAPGATRARALRSRDIWLEVSGPAGIAIEQRGAMVLARREEAWATLQEFALSAEGRGCELLGAQQALRRMPAARGVRGALASPDELRIEARTAMSRLAAWLAQAHGVTFHFGQAAIGVEPGGLRTAEGLVAGGAVVVAPGCALPALFPGLARRVRFRHCMLQMLRVRPRGGFPALPAVVMGDLSIARYEGFASQPSGASLKARLARECAPALAAGVHLIAAAGQDGTLVIGDSHREEALPDSRASAAVEALILDEMGEVLGLEQFDVVERWTGVYPVADTKPAIIDAPAPRVRVVDITNGLGMSTAFALAEETVAELFT